MTICATGRPRFISYLVAALVVGAAAAALGPAALAQQAAAAGALVHHPPHRHLGGTARDFEFSSITPAGSVEAGNSGSATVVINRQGGHTAAVTLEIAANAQGITGSGSVPSPNDIGSLTYSVPPTSAAGSHLLTVNGSDGTRAHSSTFSLTVTVVPAVINSFTATPPSIAPAGQSTLAYSFTGGTGSIDHGVGAVTSGGSTIVSPAATTTYTLTVTPPSGPSVQHQATVTVAAGSATMSTGRAYHTETLLPNGKVLLAGGRGSSYVASADLYDPASGLISPTGSMATARVSHTATLLKNGKVLIVGGFTTGENATATAEIYDPASGGFTPTGSLTRARGTHSATLLPSGEVLVVGGYNGGKDNLSSYPATCEIYNPGTGQFSDSGSLNTRRGAHRATEVYGKTFPAVAQAGEPPVPLEDRVLISGGYAAGILKSLEWYSVASGSFTSLSVSLATGRALHTATLLPSNKVLLAGGEITASLPPSATGTAELYDVATNTIAPTGSMVAARGTHTSVLVGGKVLVFGGVNFLTVFASVESYDPATGQFTTLGTPMTAVRALHTGTLLGNGKVLLAGGAYISGFSIAYRDTVELYTPPSP